MNEGNTGGAAIEILLVEDNSDDVCLVRYSLQDARLCNRVHTVGDGESAIAFLRAEGEYKNMPRPDMVLLDLNLPKKDSHEVLAEIQADPSLKDLPVILLTGSKAEEEILKAYNLNVDCFISKPVDVERLLKAVRTMDGMGISIVKRKAG